MDFAKYWQDVAAQDAEALRAWFTPDAQVLWPCSSVPSLEWGLQG